MTKSVVICTEESAKFWVVHHEAVGRQGGTDKKDWEAGAAEEGGKAGKHTFGKPRKDSFREEAVIHCMKFCL